jgi:type I restriction-modification system DNA methylase subunit
MITYIIASPYIIPSIHSILFYSIHSMPSYTCSKCSIAFKQKRAYTEHSVNCTNEVTKENSTMVDVVETKITQTNLSSFFESLHNLLWNKAGLNPERALDHMMLFFAYRLIEPQVDAMGLPDECRWSYIAGLKQPNDMFESIKEGIKAFRQGKRKTKPFFKMHEIQKVEIVYDIVRQINRISLDTLQNTDVLGDIFEYMLGRGMSTMSDEGQYFTNRDICKLAFKLAYGIKKTLRRSDGTLCTFADWFCGTGGFPAEFVKGVNAHLADVNWKTDSDSVYCMDMNSSSVTTTLLNMLILTGMPFSDTTIRSANSFSDNITTGNNALFPRLTIDYCFMNPPYGGDKTKGKAYRFTYIKTTKNSDGSTAKNYFVNQDIQSIGVVDDDKVSAGVQLAMATLSADGGVCSIVLPQGFFFGASKPCVELRRKLTEEYKIWYVVDIASGAFSNTGTKTSMLVFQKGVGSTDKVTFIGMDETVLAEASIDELRMKHYSLTYKQYVRQKVVRYEGFEMVRLGDIIEIKHGNRITKKDNIGTIYPVYGGGDESFRTDNKNREGVTCKVSRFGISEHNCVQIIYGDYWLMDSGFTVHGIPGKIYESYIYYWLTYNKRLVYQCGRATAQMNMDMDAFNDIQIPLPSLEHQQYIVDQVDRYMQMAHHEEVAVKMLEKSVMCEVHDMGRGHPLVKLGDVCKFQRGTMIVKRDLCEGEFPVIGGGISPMGYHNCSNRNSYVPLISQSGNAGYVSRYNKPVWASDCFSVSSTVLNDDFLYYTLRLIQDAISNLKYGTVQPHIKPDNIDHLLISVPDANSQQTLQEDFDEVKNKHAKIAKYKEKAQKAIHRLIPGTSSDTSTYEPPTTLITTNMN